MPLPYPFSGSPPVEVPLPRAPLVRVLSQIRFPPIFGIAEGSVVAPFQELIRADYPIAEKQVIQRITPGSPISVESESIWRFQDREKNWRVSLAPTFLALEVSHYTSRHEFLQRMSAMIAALEQTLNPRVSQRVGLRYIDRLDADALEHIDEFISTDFLGPSRVFREAAQHIVTETVFTTKEAALIKARWGLLPAQATFDPMVLEPIDTKSWIIDLDMYSDAETDLTTNALTQRLTTFSERLYAVFRYMVTERFLTYYGGTPQ